jgi:hypothetical protein
MNFMTVTYPRNKISDLGRYMEAIVFFNLTPYHARAASYNCKRFMRLAYTVSQF